MRIGIIGYGKMGMLHAGIVSALDDIQLISVADNVKFLTSFLKKLKPSIMVYSDYIKMLDVEDLDAVFITTPVNLHVSIAQECSKRGIHFFCEKPLTNTFNSALELANSLKENNVTNMVGHMMRYQDTFRQCKKILETNCLGDLITFNASIYVGQLFKEGKGWRYDKEVSGGGVLMNQGTHLIDLLYWYFGKVVKVNGYTINWYSKTVEDFVHANLKFRNGLKGWLDASWSKMHHRLVDTTISIQGEKGTLNVTDDEVKLYLETKVMGYESGWNIFLKSDLFSGVDFDIGGPQYTLQDIDFINAARAGKQVCSNVKSAVDVHHIIDSIYQSAHNGGESVDLK